MIRSTLPILLSLSACSGEPIPLAQSQRPIIEGQRAVAGQILSTVALTDGGGETFCTGTLIAPTVVITAAHCLQNEDESGWISSGDVEVAFNTLDAAPARQRRAVRSATPHPHFLQEPESNDGAGLQREDDIAVLVLSAAVDQPTTPILPQPLLDRLVQGTLLTIAGYGQTDLENEDAYGQLHIGETRFIRRNGYELLAGGNGTDTCFGDSGGPAYVTLDGVRYLVGATARAAHDARVECGDRGIYTLVPSYQSWIDQVVGGQAQPVPEVGDDEQDEGAEEEGNDFEEEDDGESGADVCAEEGWYGDGECDACDRPDPDCGEGEEGEDDASEDEEDANEEDASEDEASEDEASEEDQAHEDPAPALIRDAPRGGCQGAPGGADATAPLLLLGALLLLRRRVFARSSLSAERPSPAACPASPS